MTELTGKYNSCKMFTDTADEATITQVTNLLNQEFMANSKVRIMPDCHAGKGCVIGTTMTITDKITPSLVGVDIGCGVLTVPLKEQRIDLPKFDSVIHEYIPAGFSRHNEIIADFDFSDIKADFDHDIAALSLGSLGGGNHFIELDKDEEENLYLVIHTGSRHMGLQICDYYQDLGYKMLHGTDSKAIANYKQLSEVLIENLKAEGRENEIESTLDDLKKRLKISECEIPYVLSYVEGEYMEDYLHDMRIAQAYAATNRMTIAKRILKYAKLHETDMFDTIHNYIDLDNMILRKGSISAQKDERCIIPMNMRDGSLICIGKGNPDWNYSAPHGAGRLMSRTEARSSIGMRDFKDSMDGIYSSTVMKETIDEAPMVYKPASEIMENIKDTVDIVNIIKPIYNFKSADNDKSIKKKGKNNG